ncbi:unnamed protein product [Calypogeia fissa]
MVKVSKKAAASTRISSEEVPEDATEMETVESSGHRKRKSKKNPASKSQGLLLGGRELTWRNVTPASDSLSLLVGSEEGGFLSLEEFDGEQWNLPGEETAGKSDLGLDSKAEEKLFTKPRKNRKRKKKGDVGVASVDNSVDQPSETLDVGPLRKRKKRKADETKVATSISSETESADGDSTVSSVSVSGKSVTKKAPKEGKKRKLGSKARKLLKGKRSGEHGQENLVTAADVSSHDQDNGKTSTVSEEDYEMDMSAWAEMRLHPKLEKAIQELKFKEPTPIQRQCIPAAAHKGKDVIGAAETGSGKTLAFGLPILQRLLEGQDKASNKVRSEENSDNERERKQGPLRALIISPTRELALQICEHLKAAAKWTNVRVVPIVGGIATQKQQRLLKQMPEIVVGTPGRLWELMSGGECHLLELQSLSFFVLDEADRMVEKGHFKELQSIIDLLPSREKKQDWEHVDNAPGDAIVDPPSKPKKRRQILVFSATLALPANFKSKLKRGHQMPKVALKSIDSVAALSERAGVSHEAAIVDLTSSSIVARKLSESVVECRDEDKDQYLYYILKVHGGGRTIVFCTSIAALRRASAILRLLQIPVWPLHAQMQQRARLKTMDRFRGSEDCVLVATDVAARGLDVPGIRTVVHYQLPHSAEIYVHRSGRTARASTDGISIALVSPSDRAKYSTLCLALSRPQGFQSFPVNLEYLPAIETRISLAVKVDKLLRKESQSKATESWLARNAEAMEIDMEASEDEDGLSNSQGGNKNKSRTVGSSQLRVLQKELQDLLNQPIKPKVFSNRYITGTGMTPLVIKQLQNYMLTKAGPQGPATKKGKLVVIGQEQMEPLEALRLSSATPHSKRRR